MSVEAFVNMQNFRILLANTLAVDLRLSDEDTKLVLTVADAYANATGMLRVSETLERLNTEIRPSLWR